jgi:hypothetical protein
MIGLKKSHSIDAFVEILAALVLFLVGQIMIGTMLVGLFPDVRVSKEGVGYKYLLFLGQIYWNEISEVYEVTRPRLFKGCIALIISREGYSRLCTKGLYHQTLHARFIGAGLPILLISPGLENRDEILNTIKSKIT